MKIKVIILATIIGSTWFSETALAEQSSESLGVCMVDSMTGKERKQIAQWLFFAMAAHPDMQEFSEVTENAQKKANEFIGKLLTRLLTENCPTQAKQAMEKNGSVAMNGAFELVGKVAMQELMTNKDVTDSISGFEKFVDKEKINSVMSGK